MAEGFRSEIEPVSFARRLASSQAFSALFKEGMALVEETAAYLDGTGRQEAKALGRHAALAYATESMRLTTRLMQIASWLLLHRAVNEGEMTLTQAKKEKIKVKLMPDRRDDEAESVLPAALLELIDRSRRVQERVQWLDSTLYATVPDTPTTNPVGQQLGMLRAAFHGGN